MSMILQLAGGLGLFIFGISVMSDGLQKSAGAKTREIMESLTGSPIKGILTGAIITALIQSSSATTVMVVGFVNAGLLNLYQAAGVIMGANIGTTMTAWLVSLSEWGSILKPEFIAPAILLAGVFIQMLAKKERTKEVSLILIGFGMLFIGLANMSGAMKPLAESEMFAEIFSVLGNNPFLGLLAGMVITAILQSSSASMGILQMLAAAGIVNWGSAVFICLGQNIGTCINALISGLSADTNAKRAAMIHLEFNVIGSSLAAICLLLFFFLFPAYQLAPVTSTGLALFHTGFNVSATLVLFPFVNGLVLLSKKIIPDGKQSEPHLVRLDPRLLQSPALALQAVRNELNAMAKICMDTITLAKDALTEGKRSQEIAEKNDCLNSFYEELIAYLALFSGDGLTSEELLRLQHSLLSARDLKHISNRCRDITEAAAGLKTLDRHQRENVASMAENCKEALDEIMFKHNLDKTSKLVRTAEELNEEMRTEQIQDLNSGHHSSLEGALFLEIIEDWGRIANYCRHLVRYRSVETGQKPV